MRLPKIILMVYGFFLAANFAWAGPPYITDDPEPVEFQHWEVYIASLLNHSQGVTTTSAPHVEVNYGAVTNLQLHIIAPLGLSVPEQGPKHYGYGDTELGFKYRFIQETTNCPQIGTFPLLEVPTGNPHLGLGTGQLDAFLPIWIQKSWDPWLTYGGGGYWINPGAGNHNWWYAGWMLQRQVTTNLAVGVELYHETAQSTTFRDNTDFNIGAIYDFSEHHHLLLSGGHSFQGQGAFQTYIAFQFTFGGREEKEK
jgi:hypothetical protein